MICSSCGGGALVPAGSPRGAKILARNGVGVDYEARRPWRGGKILLGVILASMGLALVSSIFSDGKDGKNGKYGGEASTGESARPEPTPPIAAMAPIDLLKRDQDSAAAGEARGQCRMAERYQLGLGVGKDMGKAKELYRAAARQGNTDAAAALKTLGE